VSDHAEASRDIRADIGAALETVGFDARGHSGRRSCFDVPAGFRNSVNYRLRMLLIAAYSAGRHQKRAVNR
jgi:hypothetical protein